jgi:hypothetical protein
LRATCVAELGQGRVCRERGRVLDVRLIRDVAGIARKRLVIECPACGLRLQSIVDEGPSAKRYVPSSNSERPWKPRRGKAAGRERQRVKRWRQRRAERVRARHEDDPATLVT